MENIKRRSLSDFIIMQELINLQQWCLNSLNAEPSCGNSCRIAHYCVQCGSADGDCSRCLNHIQWGQPNFTYSCHKITYQYTLRFFNRFASEIYYAMRSYRYNDPIHRLNVVSLGCGPGSEVFGIIKAFRTLNMNVSLHYEGHDLLDVWEPVQRQVKATFSNKPHVINFHTSNLFADFHGFDDGKIHLLVLNYLLSHAAKFYSAQQKHQFVDDLVEFIVQFGVQNILFNDIKYYGDYARLDSGTQLMKLLINKLSVAGCRSTVRYAYFPGDTCLGNEGWIGYQTDSLVMRNLNGNPYTKNVCSCCSKQIFVHIQ